jgi:hypothetical protein
VIVLRPRADKLTVMSALEFICVLAAAMWIGYRLGRRASAPAPTWRKRARRSALGQQAIALIVLMTASQIQRSVQRKLTGSRGRTSPFARPAALTRETVLELLPLQTLNRNTSRRRNR